MKVTAHLLATLPQWAQDHMLNIKAVRKRWEEKAAEWESRAQKAELTNRNLTVEIGKLKRRIAELESGGVDAARKAHNAALEEAAEAAYANLDDGYLSGLGYATSTAAEIRGLKK